MSPSTVFIIFLAVVLAAVALRRFLPVSKGRDAALTAKVDATIAEAMAREFPTRVVRVEVKVFSGVAILGGYVREAEQARLAVAAARGVPGVTSVDNRMAVRSEG